MNWKIGSCLTILLCVSNYGAAQNRIAAAPHTIANAGMAPCDGFAGAMPVQHAPPMGPEHGGMPFATGHAFGIAEHAEIVKGEPYQAEAVTTILQTLADGTHIDHTITAKVARDAQGRTVRSEQLGGHGLFLMFQPRGQSPIPEKANQPRILTTIFDPVAHEHIDFVSDNGVAHVFHMGPPRFRGNPHGNNIPGMFGPQMPGPHGPGGGGPRMDDGPAFHPGPPMGGDNCDATVSSLGKKKINGVEVVGTRRTWTIPAGAIGNDRAIVTTEDTWYSPKLRLVLLSVRNDPRFGKTTYALKNLKLTNPEESLFRIPPGYQVDRFGPPFHHPRPGFHGPGGM